MRTVKVNKGALLDALKANRANHRQRYEKAFDGYTKECQRVLEAHLEELKKGGRHVVLFSENAPDDHTPEYDQLIKMLEMSIETEIELTYQEFQRYVMDQWEWRHGWEMSNSKYSQ